MGVGEMGVMEEQKHVGAVEIGRTDNCGESYKRGLRSKVDDVIAPEVYGMMCSSP